MTTRFATRPAKALAAGIFTALLSACGGSDGVPAAQPLACAQMPGLAVPASEIGLGTRGAKVTAARLVPARPATAQAKGHGAYCQVSAEIAAVDTAAPPIRMSLLLPEQWNGKAMMYGGGGYDGTIPAVAGNLPAGPLDQPDPIGRGYAVFGSDSGHDAATDPANPGAFALNAEAQRNFAFEALKKTRDAAQYLIRQRYAKPAQYSYFAGGSSGGREALAVVQKWPRDFQGAIALYPAFNAASLDLQFGRITRALAEPGAYPSLAKRAALHRAVLQSCDGLDGVEDGLISNQATCNQRFDPATALLGTSPLRCANGADLGDGCLSDAQIKAFKVMDTPAVFNYPLASGETQYPGFNAWGAEFGTSSQPGIPALVTSLGLGTSAPAHPMPSGAPAMSDFWLQWVRYFVTRDPSFSGLAIDPERPGPWQARISELTGLQDIAQTDLSEFEKNGGKLLMAHGTTDQLVSPRATSQYYEKVQARMGAQRTHGFMRHYEIPGYAHAFSTVFNASWDSLTALENWVEKGVAPPPQQVRDTAGVPGRSRPLCDYPAWPRYTGSGDVNTAASFVCQLP